MATTEERMEALEKKVNTQRYFLVLLGLFTVGVLFFGHRIVNLYFPHEVVRAKSFHVVNEGSDVLVRLESIAHGRKEFGYISALSDTGEDLVTLSSTTDGEGVVQTRNVWGNDLVLLATNTSGEGLVETKSPQGESLVTLTSLEDGSGVVVTYDAQGSPGLSASSNKEAVRDAAKEIIRDLFVTDECTRAEDIEVFLVESLEGVYSGWATVTLLAIDTEQCKDFFLEEIEQNPLAQRDLMASLAIMGITIDEFWDQITSEGDLVWDKEPIEVFVDGDQVLVNYSEE